MPFPATRLHYDLRIRLSELSSPAERYRLQLAAGNLNICPPQFQKVRKRHSCCFKIDKPSPIGVFGYRRLDETHSEGEWWYLRDSDNTLTECTGELSLVRFGLKDLDSDDMNRVILSPTSFSLHDCDVSIEFLQKLSKMTTPFKSLGYQRRALGIADTLKLFPHLEALKIYKCPSTPWLADLASAPDNNLKELEIEGSLKELVTFTVDEVKAYFKTLRKEFHIYLLFTNGQRNPDYFDDPPHDETWKENDKKLKQELHDKLKEVHYREVQPPTPHITVASLGEYKRSFFLLSRKRGHT
uniref:ATP synthase subunit s, mitochondrial n=1 Tax=Panagrellus redivivus TaxID=6233 RepID=A0A7E4VSV1_PANRE